MPEIETIALAQMNPTIGDLRGNLNRILDVYGRAAGEGADLVVFPELAICGYPPLDLLLRSSFVDDCASAVNHLAAEVTDPGIIVGYPRRSTENDSVLYNSAALIHEGAVRGTTEKCLLPTYDVFLERRYFQPGDEPGVFSYRGTDVGVLICEDLWNDEYVPDRIDYDRDPVQSLQNHDPELVVSLSASPFWMGKPETRENLYRGVVDQLECSLFCCNMVGGNDEVLFDGRSLGLSENGNIIGRASSFQEDLQIIPASGSDVNRGEQEAVPERAGERETVRDIHDALELGISDYLRKCGFDEVVIGLSGGIDSSVTAAMACEALGAESVMGVSMPSHITSEESKADAERLAENLGITYREISIKPLFDSFLDHLKASLDDRGDWGVAAENLQARIRGVLLMAISNRTGRLLLNTGNKSELAVGYCTLYGDMNGGLSVLGDTSKTNVYRLAEELNRRHRSPVIPERILEKPPSAELRENQVDQDVLPPYEVLDRILERMIEYEEGTEKIIEEGFQEERVREVRARVDRNEFKRRQAPPALKITRRAFGMGRHMPIACRLSSVKEQ